MHCLSVVLLAVVLSAPVRANEALSVGWPAGVPDSTRLGWETVTGEVDTPTESIRYAFYVNPARQAIYELARYRVVKVDGATRTPATEKLVWNQYPSGGRGPQCYTLEAGAWRVLDRSSEEYRSEMGTTMHVYGVHREVLAQR